MRLLFGALRRATPDAGPDPRILFALWALVVAGFTAWWEADNLEFWLVALPGILGWILFRQRHPLRGRGAWGVVLVFALANFGGSIAPKRWGPGHEELALFARAASRPRAPGEGRVWPGFGDPYVPGQVLAPLWIRSRSPQEDLSADLASCTRRIWILPETTASPGRPLDSCPGWQLRQLGE